MSNPGPYTRHHWCFGCSLGNVCAIKRAIGATYVLVTRCPHYEPCGDCEDKRQPVCTGCQGLGYLDENGDGAGYAEWNQPCPMCGTTGYMAREPEHGEDQEEEKS
jgi:DnaJ-class molecular chaperone